MLVTFRLIRLLPIIFKNGGILSVRTNHKHVIKKLKKKIRKKKALGVEESKFSSATALGCGGALSLALSVSISW